VDFQLGSSRYRSRWELHRSRKRIDGAMQTAKMFLSKLDEQGQGQIIEEKASKVPLAVQALTGLDFKRFCRSMLLAQGEFDAFLKGDDNERAELLEKMTGTEIYRDISMRVYERAKLAEQAWRANEQWQKQHLGLKGSRDIELLLQEIASNEQQQQTLKREVDDIQMQLKTSESRERLKVELEKCEQARQQIRLAAQSDSRQRWLRWKQAEPLLSLFSSLQEKKAEWQAKQRDLSELQQAQQTMMQHTQVQTQKRLLLQEQYCQLELQFETLERIYPQMLQQLERERGLLETIAQLEQQSAKNRLQMTELSAELEIEIQAFESMECEWSQLQSEFERSGRPEVQQLKLQTLLRELESSDAQAAELKNLKIQLEQVQLESAALETELGASKQKLDATEHRKKELENELALLEQQGLTLEGQAGSQHEIMQLRERFYEVKRCCERYTQCVKKDEALQRGEKVLRMEETELVDAEAHEQRLEQKVVRLQLEQQRHAFSEARLKLIAGEACPLCGSTAHQLHEFSLDEVSDQNLKEVERQWSKVKKEVIQKRERLRLETITIGKDREETLQEKTALQVLFSTWSQADLSQANLNQLQLELGARVETLQSQLDRKAQFEQQRVLLRDEQLLVQQDSQRLQLSREQKKLQFQSVQQITLQLQQKHEKSFSEHTLQIAQIKQRASVFAVEVEPWHDLTQRLELKLAKLSGQEQRLQSLLKTMRNLELTKTERQTRLKEFNLKAENLEQTLLQLQQQLVEVQRMKRELFPSQQDFLTQYRETKAEKSKLSANIAEGIEKERASQLKWQQVQTQIELIEQWLPQLKSIMEDMRNLFEASLQAQSFASVAEYEAACLSEQECAALKQWNERHEAAVINCEANQARLEQELMALPNLESAPLLERNQELTSQLEALQRQLGALQREREQELKWQAQYHEQLQQHRQLEQTYLEWDQLKRLIGSHDGNAFRRIAQRITLRFLLKLANRHLETILDRYQLVEQPEREMGIILCDRYQAMIARPLETVSGGERFMISLALALALSDISRQAQAIESLFIDEGFGALDAQALDRVLEALDKIRQMGRSIGIISHVEALKDRIPAQIQIQPTHGGVSRVFVTEG